MRIAERTYRAKTTHQAMLLAAAAASVVGLTRYAQGANATWSAAPAGSFWNAPNWVGGAGAGGAAAPGDALFFGASTVTSVNNDFAAGTTFAGLTFNSGASPFTLSGNSVNFTGGVIVNSAGGNAQTFNFGFTAGGSLAFGADASGGNSVVLKENTTVGSMAVLSNSGTANTLSVAKTLNVGAMATFGFLVTGAANTNTVLNITGAGSFNVGSPTNTTSFNVGLGNNTNAFAGRPVAVLDMSGLANFSFTTTTGAFGAGNQVTRATSTVTLANTLNVITANSIVSGDSAQGAGDNNGGGGILLLGAGSNVFNTNIINVGFGKSVGTLAFAGATGSISIIGEAGGTATTNIFVGRGSAGTDTNTASQFLLAGHQATVQAGTVQLGILAGATAGTPTGNLTFDTGTFSAGTLLLATHSSGTAGPGPIGTFTLGGALPNTTATGVLNVNNQFLLINRTNATATAALGAFNINGGTANINTDILIVDTPNNAAARNAQINLNSGTLNMMGHVIGSAALPITSMNFPTGTQTARLMNLGGGGIFAANGNGTAIATPGGVVMNGTGTLVIDGPSTNYTGGTTVNAGRVIANVLPAGGTVTLNGGTFASTITVGNLSMTGGALAPGANTVDGSAGTISMSSLNVSGGSFRLDLSQTPGASDRVTVNGTANFAGPSTIVPIFPGAAQSGSYTILTSTGLAGTPPTVNLPSNNTRTVYAVHFGDVIANAITLDVTGQAANLTWVGDLTAGGVWDVKNTPNWSSSAASDPTRFYDLDTATFDDSGHNKTVTVSGVVAPLAVFINNSPGNDYAFTGSGTIGADATVTKLGTGTATILNNNTYTGATTVNGGTLIVGGATSGSVGPGTIIVNNGGSLVFNRSDDTTVNNVIAGSGAIYKSGASTLELTATSTFTGTVNVTTGTLSVVGTAVATGVPNPLGTPLGAPNAGTVNLPVGTTLDLANNALGTNNFAFGVKQFNVAGNGGGSGVIVNNGTTQFNAFRNINLTGDATFGGSQRFDMRASPETAFNGTLTLNNHTLHINGPTFGIIGMDVNTGTIVVDNGTLSIERATQMLADPNSAIIFQPNTKAQFFENTGTTSQTRQMIINGSGVEMGITFSANTTATSFPIQLKGDLSIHSFQASTGTLILLGNITQDGTPRKITKSDTGRLVLGGNNSFTGGLDVQGGLVQLNSATALSPTGTVNLGGTGTLRLNGNSVTVGGLSGGGGGGIVDNAGASAATLTVNNVNDFSYDGALTNNGAGVLSLTKSGAGRQTLGGSNGYTGATTINAGTLQVGNGGTDGTISTSTAISGSGGTLSFNRSDSISFSGSLGGNVNLSKENSNVLTLPGTYNHTGTTAVQSGTLLVTGTLPATGTLTINDGATLTGTGTVGRLRMDANGRITPGASSNDGVIGTLTAASLSVSSGELRFDLGAGSSDLINVTGAAVFNGGSITAVGSPQVGTYTILTAGALTLTTPPTVNPPSVPNSRPANYSLNTATPNTLKLVISGGPLSITWTGGLNANAWDINNTKNWTSGVADFFYNQDTVNFTNASANRNVTITQDVAPGAVVFSHSTGSYTIGGSGITGATGITISGGGTVVLSNNNNYTGTTAVQNGTLIAGSGAIPNNNNIVLGNGSTGGALDISNDITVAGLSTSGAGNNIIGNSSTSNSVRITYSGGSSVFGGVIQDSINGGSQQMNVTVNSGSLTYTGNNTYTGQTQVNGNGALQIGAGGNTGSFGPGSINNDGTLIFNRSDTLTIASDINGGGATVVNSGTVIVGNGTNAGKLSGGAIITNATVAYNRSDDHTLTGALGGTGSLIQNGSGTLHLTSANNTISGNIVVNNGVLHLGAANSTGTATLSLNNARLTIDAQQSGPIVLNGGTATTGVATFATVTTGNVTVSPGTTTHILTSSLDGGLATNFNLSGNLLGSGTLIIDRGGSTSASPDAATGFRISGASSTFSGAIVIGQSVKGELATTVAGPYSPAGTGKIIMTAGTFDSGGLTGTHSLLNLRNNRASGNTIFGNDLEIAGTGFITLNPLNATSPAPQTSTLGNLKIGDQQIVGVNKNNAGLNSVAFQTVTLTGGNAIFAPTTSTYGSTGGGSATLILGPISEAVAGSRITMNGLNLLSLTGSNSYTGGTTVDSVGTLSGGAVGTGTLLTATNFSNGTLTIISGSARVAAKATSNALAGITVVPAISISAGSLDLTNNALVVDYIAGNSPFAAVQSSIISGYAAGSWNGTGIASSSAAAAFASGHPTALGYAEASTLNIGNFAGKVVDNTSVLVRYTLSGDANIDGKVNALDFNAVATNFGVGGANLWNKGDFNYDGQVTAADFTLVGQNFNTVLTTPPLEAPPLGSLVPEPGTIGLLALAGVSGRRRRHR